jgi:hypothetical protein
MPYYPRQYIHTQVQVVNSNGDPVTDAIVNYKIFMFYLDGDDEPVYELFESGLMTHKEDGVYSKSWYPTDEASYMFYAYSTNPKFHDSFTYKLQYPLAGVRVAHVCIRQPVTSGNTYIYGDQASPGMIAIQADGADSLSTIEVYDGISETWLTWDTFSPTNNRIMLPIPSTGVRIKNNNAGMKYYIILMSGFQAAVDYESDESPGGPL